MKALITILFAIILLSGCEKTHVSECLECKEYQYTRFLGFTTHYLDTTYTECYDEPVMGYTDSYKTEPKGIQHPFAELWTVKVCEVK